MNNVKGCLNEIKKIVKDAERPDYKNIMKNERIEDLNNMDR